ncbi:hypothetical protein NLG97_g8557 [Lecanicillium saksenae]|uniref:Uncharacterized protein n=1 Tax=Lecanicillium saksenae TaxID=468837 RepID=A0ACC1QKY4_9HYPO|nr:hypothetical protein NLG97_g8557 [Lecanicillium saksenae]
MKLNIICGALALSASMAAGAPLGLENRDANEVNPGGLPFGTIISGLSPGVAAALQQALATLFGTGDAILNTPVDGLDGVVSKNPVAGVGGALAGIPKTIGVLLQSLGKIAGDGLSAGKKPKE